MKRLFIIFLLIISHCLSAETLPTCRSPHSVDLITGEFSDQLPHILISGPMPVILERQATEEGWKWVPRSLLEEEEPKPGKLNLKTEHDEWDRLTSVKIVGGENGKAFSWAQITYSADGCEVETHEGQRWQIKVHPHTHHIQSITSPGLSRWEYQEDIHPDLHISQVVRRQGPGESYLINEYYVVGSNDLGDEVIEIDNPDDFRVGRVKLQKAPAGFDETPVIVTKYVYESDSTTVYDAHNHPTVYRYDPEIRALTSIEQYLDGSLCKVDHFYHQNYSHKKCLVSHVVQNGLGEAVFCQTFAYDAFGFVIRKTLYGNLTGGCEACLEVSEKGIPLENGIESYSTTYQYTRDERHLLSSVRNQDGSEERFVYADAHSMPVGRLMIREGKVLSRCSYVYDCDGILVQTAQDNGGSDELSDLMGVSQRMVTVITPGPHGLPLIVEERACNPSTGEEVVLKVQVNTYSQEGRLIQQEAYDADQICRQTTASEYDPEGRVIFLQGINGSEKFSSYDERGNKTRDFNRKTGEEIVYTYDYSNRPIHILYRDTDGRERHIRQKYDLNGNKIASEDTYGNETSYVYDGLSRLVKTVFPQVLDPFDQPLSPTIEQTYDWGNRIASITDPKGYVTRFRYNSRGKPIEIMHPDGTREVMTYELNGALRTAQSRLGLVTTYERDSLSRVIKEEEATASGELLGFTTAAYDTMHLLSQTDRDGNTLEIAYDPAGRPQQMTSQSDCGAVKYSFIYDSLGQLQKSKASFGNGDFFTAAIQRDVDNAIVEKRVEDAKGNLLCLKAPSETKEPIWDETTCFVPHRNCPARQTSQVDTNGNLIQTIYDPIGRPEHIVVKNGIGMMLAEREIRYDLAGNQAFQKEVVLSNGSAISEKIIRWEYGPENRLEKIIEFAGTPEERTTHYYYNTQGQVASLVKPDGVTLYYDYHEAGTLSRFYASDFSFAYEYHYDGSGRPVRIDDVVNDVQTLRQYNSQGAVTAEQLGNGLKLSYRYDSQGRKVDVSLPDNSSIVYDYEGIWLKQIRRQSASGEDVYSHRYTYDLEGRISQSHLIGNLGTITYCRDALGRCQAIESPYWSEILDYDGQKITSIITQDLAGAQETLYQYDEWGHLAEEAGWFSQTFAYDSIGNRRMQNGQECLVNNLGQVTAAADKTYIYDRNGNLLEKCGPSQTQHFRYDALNRLIEVSEDHTFKHSYTYDSFHRRLSQNSWRWKNERWELQEVVHFLYEGDREIGKTDSQGRLCELRVLGMGLGAEIGAAVAVELDGKVYAPIHDHRGALMCLVSLSSGQPEECYRYSAFGDTQIFNIQGDRMESSELHNPWRYSSKRYDEDTGLVYFGKRYYDFEIGRWISEDPLGFFDGPNRYAYAGNQPLSQIDLYGLFFTDLSWDTLYNCYSATLNWFQNLKTYANLYHTDSVNFPLFTETEKYLEEFGHLLLGQTLFRISGYYVTPSHTKTYGNGETYEKTRVTFINGILNDISQIERFAKLISTAHGGTNVHYAYRGTQGWTVDMIDCIWVKLGFISESARMLATTWKELIQSMGGVNGEGKIIHYAHSIGGTETLLARDLISPEEQKMIRVITFGSATVIPNGGFYDVINYSSRRDGVSGMVTFLPNPFSHCYFLTYGDYNLVLIGSHYDGYPIVDHLFDMYWNYWLNHASEDMPGVLPEAA